jgi:Leucine-rich repeat (LRR) protein
VWLLAKLFIVINIDRTFAAEVVVNKNNIVSEYSCALDASTCYLSDRGITSVAPDTFINHTNLQRLHLNKNKLTEIDLSGITSLTWLEL